MRAVIIGGAPIKDYNSIIDLFEKDDFFIFCDSGLYHMEKLGVSPSLIIGDFDSHKKPDTDVETIVLPTVKDDTDTVFAVKEAFKRGFTDFLITGAIGARLDHSLGNLYILLYIKNRGGTGVIADDYSEITIADKSPVTIDKKYPYFSVLNIDGSAKGINISGAEYNLENADILPEYQYGISNRVADDFATVQVNQGSVAVIKVKNY